LEDINVTLGIIVLNGEPFTRYCIRALYPHANQIIISEGACYGSRNVATPEGHSRDGTLELLRELRKNEDPENKITIVTAEDEGHPDGFWPGEKHEQCRAFTKRATGNYLWQVDIDEFYKDEDIIKIKDLLSAGKISCVSFKQFGFWGGFDAYVDGWYLRRQLTEIFRIFQWGEGYQYLTHRPPTVINSKGHDMKTLGWLRAKDMQRMGIFLYHYSFVFPKQVKEKAEYYKEAEWSKRKEAEWWANEVFLKLTDPFRVFSITSSYSWLQKFKGSHPSIIQHLKDDLKAGILNIETRQTNDIDLLIHDKMYKFNIFLLKCYDPFEQYSCTVVKTIKRIAKLVLSKIGFLK
jgi:hypothetical protein